MLINGKPIVDWSRELFETMPIEWKQGVIKVLEDNFLEMKLKDFLDLAISRSDRHSWLAIEHFGWGMAIRNLLRTKGFLDKDLTPIEYPWSQGEKVSNWDDYYLGALDATLDKMLGGMILSQVRSGG
jgi:hypothetical protein